MELDVNFAFLSDKSPLAFTSFQKGLRPLNLLLAPQEAQSRSTLAISEIEDEFTVVFVVCKVFITAWCAWGIARRAQVNFFTGAQLPRDAPLRVRDVPIHSAQPTRQSHPTTWFGAALWKLSTSRICVTLICYLKRLWSWPKCINKVFHHILEVFPWTLWVFETKC